MTIRKYFGSVYKRLVRLFAYPYGVYKREGGYFLLNQYSSMDEALIKYKPYDKKLIKRAADIIDERRISNFYDIGSNLGYYTVLIGVLPKITRICSFEPFPALYHQVGSNVLINGIIDKWKGFCCALGAEPGVAELYYHPFWLGTSSLDKNWTPRSEHSVRVDICTFDSLIDVQRESCFVKIDVEGSELGVLEGMTRFLSDNEVYLQIETSGDQLADVQQLLEGVGFQMLGDASERDVYFSNFAIDVK